MSRAARTSIYRQAERTLRAVSRETAEAERRRVDPGLFEELLARSVDCQSYALWARLHYLEHAGVTGELLRSLDQRVPGFFERWMRKNRAGEVDPLRFWHALRVWFERHDLVEAERGGWLHALAYYTAADPRFRQILTGWSEWDRRQTASGERRPLPSYEAWAAIVSEAPDAEEDFDL